jgi:hypothetical protein
VRAFGRQSYLSRITIETPAGVGERKDCDSVTCVEPLVGFEPTTACLPIVACAPGTLSPAPDSEPVRGSLTAGFPAERPRNHIRAVSRPEVPRSLRTPRSPWIYVAQALPSGNLKIGRATDVRHRLVGIQVGTWEEVALLVAVSASAVEPEAELHARFAAHRIRGEWYRPAPELLEWVAVHTARLDRRRRRAAVRGAE